MIQGRKPTLTDFITQPNIRAELDRYINFPENPCKEKEILAPLLNRRYVLIGHAFDILFGLFLEKNYKDMCHETLDIYKYQRIAYQNEVLANGYESAIKTIENYFKTGKNISSKLIDACIVLGKFENCFRCGYPPTDIQFFYRDDTEDLSRLISLLPKGILPQKRIYVGSSICCKKSSVHAADIDFILDDTVIDVKTISKIKDHKAYLRQVICYSIMISHAGLGNWREASGKKINLKKVGVYYSRFGFLETYSLNELIKSESAFNHIREILFKSQN